ncbi:cupin domain-containing protein [Bacillus mycoides]|uniref:cupin domain-containing protein n=1 Tax=Bacillus mycoides TaxID=1405 RepID=UPI0011A86C0C|nr:cupin domain-containing protein [Bacillus mycoides]
MKVFDLSKTVINQSKNDLIYKTEDEKYWMYEVIFQSKEGIPPHSHPFGEDCAIVLSGHLDYYVSNKKTIRASKGEMVFGWKNHIHGYINNEMGPLHLLILVTPKKIGLEYLSDDDPKIVHVSEEKRIMKQFEYRVASSPLSSFEKITVDGTYSEVCNEKGIVIFIHCEDKKVYIFEDEYIEITTSNPTVFIKYTAKI